MIFFTVLGIITAVILLAVLIAIFLWLVLRAIRNHWHPKWLCSHNYKLSFTFTAAPLKEYTFVCSKCGKKKTITTYEEEEE